MGDSQSKDWHHGGAIGADTILHELALQAGVRIELHPTRGCRITEADQIYPTLPPLERNRRIVEMGEHGLLAFPAAPEVVRSGTWATIRYARKLQRRIMIVYPGGVVVED